MLHLIAHRSRRLALVVAVIVVAALIAGVLTRAAQAQSAPQAAPQPVSFVYIANNDTIAVETITPGDGVVRGVLAYKGQPRVAWEQQREPVQLSLKVFAPGASEMATPARAFVFRVRGDSMAVETTTGGTTGTQRIAVRAGTVPLMGNSVLHTALMAVYARTTGRTSLPVVMTNGAQQFDASVQFVGDTSIVAISGISIRTVWRDGVPIESTIPSQGLRVVRATGSVPLPSSAVATPERPDYRAPAGAPYTAEDVTIPTTRGYTLAGTLTRPVRATPVPVVITISGSGPQERDSRLDPVVKGYAPFREIADTLGRRGIAVLRYDDRGVGASGGADSRGRATSVDFADDVLSVVAWLRTRPDIDPKRIMLLGHSEGGLIAPIAASKDANIHAIALMAGTAYDGRTILRFQIGNQVKAALAAPQGSGLRASGRARDMDDAALVRFMADSVTDALMARDVWTKHFVETNPLPTLRQVKQPVLVLQGDTDMQVTPEQADSISHTLRAAGNRAVTLRHFPATNHLFVADPSGSPAAYGRLTDLHVRKSVLGAIADWMVQVAK